MSSVSQTFATLDAWSARFEEKLNRQPGWYLFLFTFLYLGVTLPVVLIKPMWFDEFITLYVVREHGLRELWLTLRDGVDLNPPLFHLLIRGSEALFGENAFALRLPSLVAGWVLGLCLYHFVRRRTRPVFGLAAALLPMLSVVYPYTYEARPYAIVVACCAAALLCWQAACENGRSVLPFLGLCLSIAIAVSCHYYGVLLLFPIAGGEFIRTVSRKRVDWWVWVMLAAGTAPLLFFVPLIRDGMKVHKAAYAYVWNKPDVTFLWDSYLFLFGVLVYPLAVLLIWVAGRGLRFGKHHQKPATEVELPLPEISAIVTLCLVPVITYLLSVLSTGLVTARYVLPAVVGFSVLLGVGTYLAAEGRAAIGLLLLLLVAGGVSVHVAMQEWREFKARDQFDARDSARLAESLNLPVLVQDGLLALPMNYYAPTALKARMAFPVDLDEVRRYEAADTPERVMVIGRNTFPVPLVDLAQFRREHSTYLVYGMHAGWLISTVVRDGAHVRMLHKGEWQLLFLINEKRNGSAVASSVVTPAESQSQSARISPARQEAQP